jgi:magnesium transporter
MTKRKRKTGLPPGSLIYTGDQHPVNPDVTVIHYSDTSFRETLLRDITSLPALKNHITWYDVRGLHDVQLIERIGAAFDIHPLIQEDILNVSQRPKFEAYKNGCFIVAHAFTFDEVNIKLKSEQIAIYFDKDTLFTFQEDRDDLFPNIRHRMKNPQSKLREYGTDYLAYTLLDTIVDGYFLVLDKFEEKSEIIEDELEDDNIEYNHNIKSTIHHLKREILVFRRLISPLREAVGRMERGENPFIEDNSKIFLRDLFDHIIQVIDSIEIQRDNLNSLHELYISEMSLRMNNVMKVLTVISTIFIPLTFLVGVYGMNFDILPELHWKYSYFVLWTAMIGLTLVLLWYFKRKRWV